MVTYFEDFTTFQWVGFIYLMLVTFFLVFGPYMKRIPRAVRRYKRKSSLKKAKKKLINVEGNVVWRGNGDELSIETFFDLIREEFEFFEIEHPIYGTVFTGRNGDFINFVIALIDHKTSDAEYIYITSVFERDFYPLYFTFKDLLDSNEVNALIDLVFHASLNLEFNGTQLEKGRLFTYSEKYRSGALELVPWYDFNV